jgi:ribosomal protein L37AE/L43A
MHKEKQTEFHYIQNELIPKLERELLDNKEFLKKHVTGSRVKLRTDDILDEVYRVRDRNREIKETLTHYKHYIKNYYLTNNKYIFSYFEDKKEISDAAPLSASASTSTSASASASASTSTSMSTPSHGMTKNKIIQSFFKVATEEPEHKPPDKGTELESDETTVRSDVEPRVYVHKLTNLQHYLQNTGKAVFDYDKYAYQSDVCSWCNRGELVAIESEGILVCNKCSNFTVYYVESDKPSYKEPPKEASFYAYRRINHFREILAQVQAKETTQIDDSIITAIENQIHKERITLDQLTDAKAKEILKKLGYNKYYEHIPFIKEKLGIKPPVMTPELEETLCNLFMETQGPYARFCPDERVNFLNYYYTVYKLCELLGQTQYLPYFPMLKDRDKRIEQDEIWKKICKELNWEFIPTP